MRRQKKFSEGNQATNSIVDDSTGRQAGKARTNMLLMDLDVEGPISTVVMISEV